MDSRSVEKGEKTGEETGETKSIEEESTKEFNSSFLRAESHES